MGSGKLPSDTSLTRQAGKAAESSQSLLHPRHSRRPRPGSPGPAAPPDVVCAHVARRGITAGGREVDAWLMQQTGSRLLSRCVSMFTRRVTNSPPPTPFQMSPASQQMQPTQTLQSPPPSGGRRRRVVDEDPDERRRKFLERNRAAATRCRQKRKVWVMSLEKKAEELTQTNMQLQVRTLSPSPCPVW